MILIQFDPECITVVGCSMGYVQMRKQAILLCVTDALQHALMAVLEISTYPK
jgi:hypothetical protein